MLLLPENWTSFVVRDPAGNSLLSGNGSRQADLSSLAPGRYSLTSSEGSARYEIIRSSNIPNGVLVAKGGSGNSTQIRFGAAGDAGPYLVSVKDVTGNVQQSFYIYSPDAAITFPAGDWRVTIARPGENGFNFAVNTDANGKIQALDRVGLIDKANWFLDSLSFGSKVNNFASSAGLTAFQFNDNANPEHVVQVRERNSGMISTYFTQADNLKLALGSGNFEWRILGISQSSVSYPALTKGLNAVQGGWTPFTSRFDNARTPTGLYVPTDMLNFTVRSPEGNTVISDTLNNWIDVSILGSGRYSLSGQGLNGVIREELVVGNTITGGVASLRGSGNGKTRLTFHDETPAPYYVSVKKTDGSDVTTFYNYSSVVDLQLGDGEYVVSIAESGSAGFSVRVHILGGALTAVDRVLTANKLDWYLDSLTIGDPLGPINTSSGVAHFSFDAGRSGNFLIQIRDPATGTIGNYEASQPGIDIAIGLGFFQWRAIGLPDQLEITGDVIARLTAVDGGWTSLERVAQQPDQDYVLGREPDKVSNAADLILNYPADALLLDDGSIVVTNNYGASVIRIMPDGSLQRLAGGDREGYTEKGFGNEVLLRGPGQLYDNKDGTVLFTDTRNFVVRQINLATGFVRNLFGDPNIFAPTIVNGQITGLGDIYDIGKDNHGNLFITAASTEKYGDQQYSSNTVVLRQNSQGQWYFWEPDISGLIIGSFKFVDRLFHDGIVSVLAHDGADKRYLKYSESGILLGQVTIGASYGGGLTQDPTTGDLLIGNHTSMVRLNWNTLQTSDYPFPQSFANVSFMNRNGNKLALVDSDRGRVYNYDLESGQILRSIGLSTNISNVVVDLEATQDGLLALDNQTPRIISIVNGRISSIAGTGQQGVAGVGSRSDQSTFYYPNAISKTSDGSIYIVEANHRVLKISPDGVISAFAGALQHGYSGDGGLAKDARFQSIYGIDASDDGKLYITDSFNHAVRVVGVDGKVTTLAGNGQQGLGFSPGMASLNVPMRVLVTKGGRILISDSWNNRIVEMASDGSLVPVAGIGFKGPYQGTGDFSGDGGAATAAELNTPVGIALYDADGTLFIADSFNNRIRYMDSAGNIHTLIGADRGYAFGTLLNLPSDVALVGDDLYIADTGNALVLKLVGVDRTGNDLTNSLDVGKAISRARFASRSEYVGTDDVDCYNLTGLPDGIVTVTAANAGLTIDFTTGDNNYYGKLVLGAGQSVMVTANDHSFMRVSANTTQKYTMSFGEPSRLSAAMSDATVAKHTEVNGTIDDQRIPLMIQAMTAFSDGHSESPAKFREPTRTVDFFA